MFNIYDSDTFLKELNCYLSMMKDLNNKSGSKEKTEDENSYGDVIEDVNYRVLDEVVLLYNPSNK